MVAEREELRQYQQQYNLNFNIYSEF